MPQDIVQLGSIAVSKYLVDVLAPLIGTLIGGLITYLATRGVENYKLARAKYDRQQEQRREAIALALEWIDPIKTAAMKSISRTRAFIENYISDEEYLIGFPDLIHDLASKDLPVRLRIWLPQGIVSRGYAIHQALEELRIMAIGLKQRERIDPKARLEAFGRYLQMASELDRAVSAFEDDLTEQYKATFA
jgi:hypothetical protein